MEKIADVNVPSCSRCRKPIIKGQRVWAADGGGLTHFGCKSKPAAIAPFVAAAVPQTILEFDEEPGPAELGDGSGAVIEAVIARLRSDMAVNVSRASNAIARNAEKKIEDAFHEICERLTNQADGLIKSNVMAATAKAAATASKSFWDMFTDLKARVDAEISKTVRHVVEVRSDRGSVVLDNQVFHSCFQEVLELAGAGMNIFLPGPTGCGKTHLAGQVAQSLGLDFGMISGTAGTTESEILGTSIPNLMTGENVYIESEFVRVYENGGIFLIDEADAMDPNCLLKINAAISNGRCVVPKRYAKPTAVRHNNFVPILAANTYGHGATRMYCGRNRLDGSTLDRFLSGTVPMDYDSVLESRLCPDRELYEKLSAWRKKIYDNKFLRVLSTRFCIDAYKLKTVLGRTDSQILQKLIGGWSEDEVKIMQS